MSERILVLGGSGMLGHVMSLEFSKLYQTYITSREPISVYSPVLSAFKDLHVSGVSARCFDSVLRAFAIVRPTCVINCIGVVKQVSGAHDALEAIQVNSLFPHQLAEACKATGSRLISFSTDCVFSGEKGNYSEEDLADPADLYGRSKLLGEVDGPNCLTIRTSMIGWQVRGHHGLLEWLVRQAGGKISGYTRAIFSGFTTEYLARLTVDLVANQPELSGVFHLSSSPISKYDLLVLINDALQLGVEIEPCDTLVIDRSLDSSKLRGLTNIEVPSWDTMVEELARSRRISDKERLVRKC